MLRKLMKYDFLAMSKILFPIYIAMFVMTTIFSLMVKLNFDNGLVFGLCTALYVAAIFTSIFGTIRCAIVRFNSGLLNDEGYLSFSLPVKTSTHIIAKVLNAIVWSIIEGLALFIMGLICALILGSIKEVGDFFYELFRLLKIENMELIISGLRVLLILILGLISSICLVYLAISIGHLVGKHRLIVAIVAIVAITVIRSNVLVLFVNLNNIVVNNQGWIALHIFSIISIALYSIGTWYILDKHLNLG